MRGPGTSKHCVTNMAADEEAAIAAVIAAIFLANKEEEENREIVLDLPNVLAVLYTKERRHIPRITGYAENVVPAYPLSVFKESFRLSRSTFETLTEMLAGCPEFLGGNERGGRPQVDVSKQLLITLWVLGNQESYRSIGERFNVAKSTVFNCLLRVCNALVNNYRQELIRWPTEEQAVDVMDGFEAMRGFPGVIGARDGSHIPIKAPQICPENYINRKGFYSIILQAVCNDQMLFTDTYVGWPGSVHDARVFDNSDLLRGIENNPDTYVQGNSHIIGDSAYGLAKFMMTPFRDNGHLTAAQKKYNKYHSSTRMVIERAFGHVKGCFRRLKYLDVEVTNAPLIVMAVCILHNLCIIHEDDIEDFIEGVEEEVNGFINIFPARAGGEEKRNHIMEGLY